MKKILLIQMILLSFMTSYGFAISSQDLGNAGFNNLSTTQQAEILRQVGEMRQTTAVSTIANADPEKVDQWVNIGSNIGKGLAGAAKELGVQINEFSDTKVGQLTVFLIVWHIMGNMIYHFIGGILVWIIGFLAIWFIRAKIAQPVMNDDGRIAMSITVICVIIAGLICMFTYN